MSDTGDFNFGHLENQGIERLRQSFCLCWNFFLGDSYRVKENQMDPCLFDYNFLVNSN